MGPPAPLKETKYFTFTIFNPFYSKTFIFRDIYFEILLWKYRFVFASFSFHSSSAMFYPIGAEVTEIVISNISAVRFTYHNILILYHDVALFKWW